MAERFLCGDAVIIIRVGLRGSRPKRSVILTLIAVTAPTPYINIV